jgi:hypothetical protein
MIILALYTPNGWRYLLVGGTRQRRFDGTSLKPTKLPENAATPTSRVHALLGGFTERNTFYCWKTARLSSKAISTANPCDIDGR